MGLSADGYELVRGLIPEPTAAAIAASADEIPTACGVEVCRRTNNNLIPMRWTAPALSAVLGSSERMQRVVRTCGDGDLRWLSAYLSIKEPRTGPLPWHQDWWCWDHPITYSTEPPQVALLCYVDPAGISNGALRVLPGSHRHRSDFHRRVFEADADADPADPVMQNQAGQLTIDAAPGDAVLVDYRLLHGTHENRSSRARSCLILNFAPNWPALPDEIRGHLIQSWALPNAAERRLVDPVLRRWMPSFSGCRRTLALSRAPRRVPGPPSPGPDVADRPAHAELLRGR